MVENLTPAQRDTLQLWAERTEPGRYYYPNEVFPERNNTDNARRRTMTGLAGQGVIKADAQGRLSGGNPFADLAIAEASPAAPEPWDETPPPPPLAEARNRPAQCPPPRPAPPPAPHWTPPRPAGLAGELGAPSLGAILRALAEPADRQAVKWRTIDRGKGLEAPYLPVDYIKARLCAAGPWAWEILARWIEDPEAGGGGKRTAMVHGRLTLLGSDRQAAFDGLGGAPLGDRPADDTWQAAAAYALKNAAGCVTGLDLADLAPRRQNGGR